MKDLQSLVVKALAALGDKQTFDIKNIETKPARTGKVGFKVVTEQGKTITFWSSNMDRVVEVVDEAKGLYQVKPGTIFAEDGGLIPSDSATGGFWD